MRIPLTDEQKGFVYQHYAIKKVYYFHPHIEGDWTLKDFLITYPNIFNDGLHWLWRKK